MTSYFNVQGQKKRIKIIIWLFVLLFFAVISRLYYLQVYKHSYYVNIASSQHLSKDTIPAKRGQIYVYDTVSGNPYLLATNQTLDLVFVDPSEVEDKEVTADKLAGILNLKKEDILTSINVASLYVPLKHKLSESESQQIKASGLKGVGLIPEYWRYYPENTLACSILGFVDAEGVGKYGLEEYFNQELSGTPGQSKEETDNIGVKIVFGENVLIPAKDGSSLYLTLDRYIQGKAEALLAEAVTKFNADSGTVIVMDSSTGKILAMANNPVFDPNKYTEIKENDYSVFKNKAMTDSYEPGSIFKVITMAAGLDSGMITPETTYEDTGSLVIDGNKIMNSDKKTNGIQTMTNVLEKSLNTGTTWVEQKLGKNLFYEYLQKFGFGKITGIEFFNEATGILLGIDELNNHGFATVSFGQSISTTPLQMITAFSAVANGGTMMKPYIIDKIVGNDGDVTETAPKEVAKVISEESAKDLTTMMISVVNNGHGMQAKVAGYKIAGKTGTAQVVKEDGTGYESNKNIGTFIGFSPTEGADFVVLAKIDNPKNVAWAESTAAPIVGSMLDFLLKYYNVPPTE
jgi:cell division protein FtsI (penicillin-binding protein 3)/stage V sporulation protein D (sporulation-specific penicillin-binding protein)